jgi:hypothetical protein
VTRWPLIEMDGGWDMASIYYERVRRPVSAAGRTDVFDALFEYSGVLLDVTRLSADSADLRWATTLHVAWQTSFDMRLSTTTATFRRSAEIEGRALDASYLHDIATVAEHRLCGVALVSALRACAHSAFRIGEFRLRAEFSCRARSLAAKSGAWSCLSSVIADDAHAHLGLAARIEIANAEVVRRNEVDRYRRSLIDQGCRLLAAAFAQASTDPWNPFVRYRLAYEVKEHGRQIHDLEDEERVRYLTALLESAQQLLLTQDVDLQTDYEQMIAERPERDIDAYFFAKMRARGERYEPRPSLTEALLSEEPTWTRLV